MRFRLPEIPDCKLPTRLNESKVVTLTLFWEDISKQSIDGHECFGVEQRFKKSFRVYIRDYIERKDPEKKLGITEEECKEMIKYRKAPNRQEMKPLSEGVIGTSDESEPDHWIWTTEAIRTNFYVVDVKMTVSNDESRKVYASTSLEGICSINSGVCPTSRGILVWDKGDYRQCRMSVGKTTECLFTDTLITCPDVHMSMSSIQSIKLCEISFGTSEQGVYFTTRSAGETVRGIVSTKDALAKVTVDKAGQRGKRSVALWTDVEDAARTQFIWRMLKDMSEANVAMFHDYSCRNDQLFMNYLMSRVELGEASIVARTFLNDNSYRAKMEGDFVVLWKCEEIRNYFFLDNKECTLEYPVRFTLHHISTLGYMRSKTHEIIDYPTKGPCPPNPFYFNSNGTIILLDTKEVVRGIDVLPHPFGLGKSNAKIPDQSFRASGFHKAQDIVSDDAPYEFMKMNSISNNVERVIKKLQHGEKLDENDQMTFDSLFGISSGPFYNYFAFGMKVVLCVFLVIGLALLMFVLVSCCVPMCGMGFTTWQWMCNLLKDLNRKWGQLLQRSAAKEEKQSVAYRPLPPVPSEHEAGRSSHTPLVNESSIRNSRLYPDLEGIEIKIIH